MKQADLDNMEVAIAKAREERRQAIRRAAQSMTLREVGERYGITAQRVFAIVGARRSRAEASKIPDSETLPKKKAGVRGK